MATKKTTKPKASNYTKQIATRMDVVSFAKLLDSTWIGAVPIQPKAFCKEWNCHNNTIEYVDWYGGLRVIGYYILEDVDRYIAILHSIVMTYDNKLIDITPFSDWIILLISDKLTFCPNCLVAGLKYVVILLITFDTTAPWF